MTAALDWTLSVVNSLVWTTWGFFFYIYKQFKSLSVSGPFSWDVAKQSPLRFFVDWDLPSHSQEQVVGKLVWGASLSSILCSLYVCFSRCCISVRISKVRSLPSCYSHEKALTFCWFVTCWNTTFTISVLCLWGCSQELSARSVHSQLRWVVLQAHLYMYSDLLCN